MTDQERVGEKRSYSQSRVPDDPVGREFTNPSDG